MFAAHSFYTGLVDVMIIVLPSKSLTARTESGGRTLEEVRLITTKIFSNRHISSKAPLTSTTKTGEVKSSGGVFEDEDSSAELASRTVVSVALRRLLSPGDGDSPAVIKLSWGHTQFLVVSPVISSDPTPPARPGH